jgi:hypothetical protein
MEGDRDANCTNFQEFLEINSGPQTGRKTKMHRQNMRLGGTDPLLSFIAKVAAKFLLNSFLASDV